MFLNCVRRLLLVKTNPPKCSIRNFLRISDACSIETLGKRTKVQGWVYAVRKMKNHIFVEISDGSTAKTLQVVVPKSIELKNLSYRSSIVAEGELKLAPDGRNELFANNLSVIGTCELVEGYPFAPRKQYAAEYIRQYLHLRPQTLGFSSVLRLRDLASLAISDHFRSRNFIKIHTPVLTSNDCEGAGETFTVTPDSIELHKSMQKQGVSEDNAYFDTKSCLTVSGQLHLEVVSRAITKVYSFGPTFRAENSKSRVHLSEFYMLEAEIAFVNSLNEIMDECEVLVKDITKMLFKQGASDIQLLGGSEPSWVDHIFARMTYDEAVTILQNHCNRLKFPITYGHPLSKEHELFLVHHNNGIPVFIINWPKKNKPFYMKECENDASKVAAMDLLAPDVGELIGGSLREDNYAKLESKLPATSNLSWYLELRKFGNVPTGGFGLGFERFLQCALGISNIKDTIPFPRWAHNCSL